jgi:hypothetical protein
MDADQMPRSLRKCPVQILAIAKVVESADAPAAVIRTSYPILEQKKKFLKAQVDLADRLASL